MANHPERGATIEALPGTRQSPRTVLSKMLREVEDMEAVLVVPIWKGEREEASVHWSVMRVSLFAFTAAVVQRALRHILDEATELDVDPGDTTNHDTEGA